MVLKMGIRYLPIFTTHLIIFPLLFCSSIMFAAEEDEDFVKSLKPSGFFGGRREKLSHFRLYWHDIYSGKRPSAMQIVTPPLVNNKTGFGIVSVIDDPLTLGPSLRSRLVGRAQGFYALASQEEVGLLMTMNFAFLEGKYSGSYITVLGRNPVLNTVREMSVIGGSGIFRLARGYVKAKTYWFNTTSGDAIVEYNVYVLHY